MANGLGKDIGLDGTDNDRTNIRPDYGSASVQISMIF